MLLVIVKVAYHAHSVSKTSVKVVH